MTPILVLDLLAVAVSAATIVIVATRSLGRRPRIAVVPVLLTAALMLVRSGGNVLETTAFVPAMAYYEDYWELLLPLAYFFSFYAITQARLNAALVESEARHRSLVDNVQFGVTLVGRDGRALASNAWYGEGLGLDEGLAGWIPCPLRREWREGPCDGCPGHDALDCGTATEQFVELRVGGERRYLEVRAIPQFDAEGRPDGFLEVVEERTEQILAQRALEKSEACFRSVVESTHEGLLLVRTDGVVVLANPAAAVILDREGPALVGAPLLDALEGVTDPTARARLADAIADPPTPTFGRAEVELTVAVRNAKRRTLAATVGRSEREDAVHALVVLRDVTATREAEAERALLASAGEQAGDGLVITDVDGRVRFVNSAYVELTGYSAGELLGEPLELTSDRRRTTALGAEIDAVVDAGAVWHGRLANRRSDGTAYVVDASVSRIATGDGEFVGRVYVQRDVTDRLALEARLRQGQKMEALGTLAGGIAHDFNNLLTSLQGHTQLALLKLPDADAARASLEQVMRAGDRAGELVQQILTFTRASEQERVPVDVARLAKETLKLLRSPLPPTVEVREFVRDDVPRVLADPTELHQVLMNLCTNAYQAMGEAGGRLELRLSSAPPPIGAGEAERGPRWVQLIVEDTGCGMSADVQTRAFEPYFTTKDRGEGTGLGLSTVHGVVEGMGGTIALESRPGVGTQVRVLLPGVADDVADPAETDTRPAAVGGAERVLFVDDDVDVATVLAEGLTQLGFAVTTVHSSEAALHHFGADPSAFDVVVTDYMMPGMKGRELIGRIREQRPDCPVVLCSGFMDHDGWLTEVERSDRPLLVRKPVVASDLARAIRSAVDNCRSPSTRDR